LTARNKQYGVPIPLKLDPPVTPLQEINRHAQAIRDRDAQLPMFLHGCTQVFFNEKNNNKKNFNLP